jgi:hypothetical protein
MSLRREKADAASVSAFEFLDANKYLVLRG